MKRRSITWQLPAWMFDELDLALPRANDEEKMTLAIDVARRNVARGGGPFGAVVFDIATGVAVAPGANLVVPQSCSLLHAEIVAITFAQAELGSYTLGAGRYELVTSSEPCVQCLGAIFWAGLSRLVCGAPVADAEELGFDEGPRRDDWREQLALRGIAVAENVLASEARRVLSEYRQQGGVVYGARSQRPKIS